MRLFAGGPITPLVVKIRTKPPRVKMENPHNSDRDFALFRGKIWLWLFYNFFCVVVLRFYTKNEGVTLIFPIQNEIKILENRRHAFIFYRNNLRCTWNSRAGESANKYIKEALGGSLEACWSYQDDEDRSTKSSISSVDFKDCSQPGDGVTLSFLSCSLSLHSLQRKNNPPSPRDPFRI